MRVPSRTGRPALIVAAFLTFLVLAPAPARAASELSDGVVTPLSGTTATVFTFSVASRSTESPQRPAQAVWAEVVGLTVPLLKVSGRAIEGTWQGTATLPVGVWPVVFGASTSSDPQPAPLVGPIVTVAPAPTPTPTPTPAPTPRQTMSPTARPTATATAWAIPAPLASTPGAVTPSALPEEGEPRPRRDDRSSDRPTPSATPTPSDSVSGTASAPTDDAGETAVPSATPRALASSQEPPPSSLAAFLFVGGTMSLAGAAVLARQWLLTRGTAHR